MSYICGACSAEQYEHSEIRICLWTIKSVNAFASPCC